MNKKWKHTLDFSGFYKDDSIDIVEKGKKISVLIRRKFSSILDYESEDFDQELEDIVDVFESISGYDDVEPVEEFDDCMESLYNWADYNRIWIKVM